MHLHELVDLAGGLDESGDKAVLLRSIGHVIGIKRDAVTADARAGIKGHESIGFGGRGVDHLPDVDIHSLEDEGHLVDEGNVYVPKDVLDHLHGLGRTSIANRDGPLHDTPIERGGNFGTLSIDAADDGRHPLDGEVLIPRVNPLWRVRDAKVAAGDESGLFQDRDHHLIGRPGVGGALKDHKLPGMKDSVDGRAGTLDITQVRDLVLREGGRDADDEKIAPTEIIGIRCREIGMPEISREFLFRDILNVGFPCPETLDSICTDIVTEDSEFLRKGYCEGEANVPLADDTYFCAPISDL